MRLVTFRDSTSERIGALVGDGSRLIDLSLAAPSLPPNMLELIAMGPPALALINKALQIDQEAIAIQTVRLLAPIPRPARSLFCIGKNYRDHAREFHRSGFDAHAAQELPDAPVVFSKLPSTVIGPGEPIPAHLDRDASVDYENELAVIIGKAGRGISREQAGAHIFGYTIINDVTARIAQQRHKQWFLGKNLDGFCPMGPAILTADEMPDAAVARLTTRVNGELRQDACVADLIFDIPTLIETLSAGITLLPGDIIASGTPAGVGIGFVPPKFLRRGDVVSLTIDPIGELVNPVD